MSCRDSKLSLQQCSWASLPEAVYQSVHSLVFNWLLLLCSCWIRGKGRKVTDIFSLPYLNERMYRTRGSITVPLASHPASLPIELPRNWKTRYSHLDEPVQYILLTTHYRMFKPHFHIQESDYEICIAFQQSNLIVLCFTTFPARSVFLLAVRR